MTTGWLCFFLALGAALMVAAAQQLVPTVYAIWQGLFVIGLAIVVVSLAAYWVRDGRHE